ncbi:MAG: helix-turn-helix domain-containing protein [Flavobacteriaceae bacterium]
MSETDRLLAARLRDLRQERRWTLDDLAGASGVSRATLSRLENAEVSPTAHVLGRLCTAYGMPMSRLMRMVESGFSPLVRPVEQPEWTDPATGFRRRSVSPPTQSLAGEVVECALPAGTAIDYPTPPRSGLEHHLLMIEGRLFLTVADVRHDLSAGDCLRYRLAGPSRFETAADGARYLLFLI